MDTQAHAVVVPSEAVQPTGSKAKMVYVVKSDQTVEPQNRESRRHAEGVKW